MTHHVYTPRTFKDLLGIPLKETVTKITLDHGTVIVETEQDADS